MKTFDVGIVGAGPAGSSTAIILARRGYSVALIDKEEFPREKLCGDFINPANWPILQSLGVERKIAACAHERITAFLLTGVSGEEIEVPFSPVAGAPVSGLGLRRVDFDKILLEQARAEGAALHLGFKIERCNRTANGWLLSGNGGEAVRARVLVGADGRNSLIAHRLGTTRSVSSGNSALGGQIRLRSSAVKKGTVQIHIFPGGYAGVANVGKGIATLGFAVKRDEFARQRYSTENLLRDSVSQNAYLRAMLEQSEIIGEPQWTSPVYFPPRQSYGNGFLLVGDAARVNEPVSGEGIYVALKSGEIAGRTLDRAFQTGNLSAPQLRSYEVECRSVFGIRRALNCLLRGLVYRPAFVARVIRLSQKTRLIERIVQKICQPEPAAFAALSEGPGG
jgi:geranylgeranyl reductase family protein